MKDYFYIPVSFFYSMILFTIDIYFPEISDKKKKTFINYSGIFNAVILGIPSIYLLQPNNIVDYLSQTNPYEIEMKYKIIPLLTYGYGLHDLYHSIIINKIEYIIHGLSVIIFLTIGFMYNSIHISLLGTSLEMSSIFLNFRYNDYSKLLFFISYIYYRIYYFPQLCVTYYNTSPYNKQVYYTTLLGMLISNTLNLIWFKQIIKIIYLTYIKNNIWTVNSMNGSQ